VGRRRRRERLKPEGGWRCNRDLSKSHVAGEILLLDHVSDRSDNSRDQRLGPGGIFSVDFDYSRILRTLEVAMTSAAGWKKLFIVCLLATTPLLSRAQTFETLLIFDGTDGATPVDTPLVQGRDGYLYGTTLGGGSNVSGEVFRLTSAGQVKTLYSFCSQPNCADGALPYGGLVLGIDGNFYGTTSQGGASSNSGTVYKIRPNGTLTTLHTFNGTDGAFSEAPMVQGTDGNFYGITQSGGDLNAGTVFKITPSGVLTTLHSLGSTGSYATGPLVEGSDGNFYGTTELGGANGYGTIFKVSPTGTFSTFHSFNSTDGSAPACGLVQASDGNLYGTTYEGGSNNSCPNGCGTIFKISLAGTLTTLHNFDYTEGAEPIAALIQATDGNFYGTTYSGGTGGGWGTVFKVTSGGTVTTIHSFSGSDGAQPYGPVAQATNGNLYGTATNGTGAANQGTLFAISTGLSPFVGFVRNTGKIGQTVGILGQGFAGTTSVSFNGVLASFSVNSKTFITATVPAGGTSGFVKVVTPSGTLRSNVRFRVMP
jgi:uncharacterized repeat protein (TIGR03803 family)